MAALRLVSLHDARRNGCRPATGFHHGNIARAVLHASKSISLESTGETWNAAGRAVTRHRRRQSATPPVEEEDRPRRARPPYSTVARAAVEARTGPGDADTADARPGGAGVGVGLDAFSPTRRPPTPSCAPATQSTSGRRCRTRMRQAAASRAAWSWSRPPRPPALSARPRRDRFFSRESSAHRFSPQ